MKILVKQPQLINILNAINVLVDEATIEVTDKSLSFRGMDQSHIAMINVEYTKSEFEEYYVEQDTKFAVRVAELLKVVKRFDKDEIVGLGLSQQDSKLIVSSKQKHYSLPLIEASASSSPLPKLKLTTHVGLERATLEKIVGDIEAVTDKITLEAKSGGLFVSGIGDTGECMINVGEEVNGDDAKATYSLDYVSKMVRAIKSDGMVAVEYSSKMPLKLAFDDDRIAYYLAPRVEE